MCLCDVFLCFGLSNVTCVFASKQEGVAHLIDWDLSGKVASRCYPDGFNPDIGDDGRRHADAVAGSLLKFEHDVHALVFLLDRFHCSDVSLEAQYRPLLQSVVSTGDLAVLLLKLKSIAEKISDCDASIMAPSLSAEEPHSTGTPIKKGPETDQHKLGGASGSRASSPSGTVASSPTFPATLSVPFPLLLSPTADVAAPVEAATAALPAL